MTTRGRRYLLVVALWLGTGCEEMEPAGNRDVVFGSAAIWLTTSKEFTAGQTARPELIEVTGVVKAVAQEPAKPPRDRTLVFATDYGQAKEVISIVDGSGVEWTLGYELRRGNPATDVTPRLPVSLVGSPVRLLFRQTFWNFGGGAGFVLSDDAGPVAAMDLAEHTINPISPLQPNDVPGLMVGEGTVFKVEPPNRFTECFSQEHGSLVFKADAVSEVLPGRDAAISIQGVPFTAHNIFKYRAVGMVSCTDVPMWLQGWAVFRMP
ncbi:MAG TPA: hypothetical protein VGF45_21345 [Polyangia bacterium]